MLFLNLKDTSIDGSTSTEQETPTAAGGNVLKNSSLTS